MCRATLRGVLYLSAVLLFASQVLAETDAIDPTDVRARLKAIESKIDTEQKRLVRLEQERDSIGRQLQELDKTQKDTQKQQEKLQESVIALSTEAERLKLILFGARQQMEQQRARMHRRVVALYKTQQRSSNAEYLLRSQSTADLLKRAKYLSRLTEHDQEFISQLTSVVRQGQDDRKRLEELLNARKSKLAELTSLGEQLEAQKFQAAGLLREREAKAEQQESSLVALRLSANQLQSMLSEMMDKEQGVVTPPTTPTQEESGFTIGLARLRGRLEFPVSGQLVQGFGKQRHNEFEDILFKKGVEIACDEGEVVRVVAPGKVLFKQELPGYGPVVIIDHGRRYYTLYGRLSTILVQVGELVESGQPVGHTGAVDAQGRNFYFELRHEGKAKDPTSYFRKIPRTV